MQRIIQVSVIQRQREFQESSKNNLQLRQRTRHSCARYSFHSLYPYLSDNNASILLSGYMQCSAPCLYKRVCICACRLCVSHAKFDLSAAQTGHNSLLLWALYFNTRHYGSPHAADPLLSAKQSGTDGVWTELSCGVSVPHVPAFGHLSAPWFLRLVVFSL